MEYQLLSEMTSAAYQHLTSYNVDRIGFLSDSHCRIDLLSKIINLHPDRRWIHLGDITYFEGNQRENDEAVKFVLDEPRIIGVCRSNHDIWSVRDGKVSPKFNDYLTQRPWEIVLNDQVKCYHSFPRDYAAFVEKHITEREFVDEFDTDCQSIVVGHNHEQFIKHFPGCDAALYSIGAVQNGCYALMDAGLISLHKHV